MSEDPRRQMTLADLMWMVAATCPGLMLLQSAIRFRLFSADSSTPFFRLLIEHLGTATGCLLPFWMVTLFLLSLRQPRPALREVAAGPGFIACITVMLSTVVAFAFFLGQILTLNRVHTAGVALAFNNAFGKLINDAGLMTVGAWLTLWILGELRFKPSWIDRFACVLGAVLVAIYAYVNVYFAVVRPWLLWFG